MIKISEKELKSHFVQKHHCWSGREVGRLVSTVQNRAKPTGLASRARPSEKLPWAAHQLCPSSISHCEETLQRF